MKFCHLIKTIFHIYLLFAFYHGEVVRAIEDVPNLLINDKTRYVKEGDINLASIFSFNRPDPNGLCTDIYYNTVYFRIIETVVFGIKTINERTDILPNITLGFVIVDSCYKGTAALAHSVYFVPNKQESTTNSKKGNDTEEIQKYKIAGVIGPLSSSQSVMASSFLSVYQIPSISPASTSDELSDKSRYEYFLRTVPPDKYQSYAIADILVAMNWSYVSLVFSEGSYGENGAKQIEKRAKEQDICIAFSGMISSEGNSEDLNYIIKMLKKNMKARVVVLFISYNHQRLLFQMLRGDPMGKYFIFVGSDFFRPDAEDDLGDGAIKLTFEKDSYQPYEEYFYSLTPENNKENPWIKDHWAISFDCFWNITTGNKSCYSFTNMSQISAPQLQFMGCFDIINIYAKALDHLITTQCPEAFNDKTILDSCVSGPDLLKVLKNLTYQGVDGVIKFDEKGDMIGQYFVVQYDYNKKKYERLGIWEQGSMSLKMNLDGINWDIIHKKAKNYNTNSSSYLSTKKSLQIPESVCSHPCLKKEYIIMKELKCCWECGLCRSNEIITDNSTGCHRCEILTWPDEETQTYCEEIPPYYMHWSDSIAVVLVVLASTFLVSCIAVSILLVLHRDEKLVKASSRELSTITMLGVMLSYATVYPIVARPTEGTCYITHVGFNLSVTFLYAPLLVKTSRIYRIFSAGKQGTKRPRFVGNRFSLSLVACLLLIQILLLIVSAVVSSPTARLRMQVPTEKHVELFCDIPLKALVGPLSFNMIIILICAVYGFMTRKLPENFNESWFIFLSVSTTTFLWLVFLPTYFTQFYAYNQAMLLSFCLIINAAAILLCIFIPKIYAIKFVDEQNMKLKFSNGTAVGPSTQVSAITNETE